MWPKYALLGLWDPLQQESNPAAQLYLAPAFSAGGDLQLPWVWGTWHPATGWRFTKDKNCPFSKDPLANCIDVFEVCFFLIQTAVLKATCAFKNKFCLDRTHQPVHRRGCNSMPGTPKGLAIYCRRKKIFYGNAPLEDWPRDLCTCSLWLCQLSRPVLVKKG